jgi:transcriptional regulator of arginine metabolism
MLHISQIYAKLIDMDKQTRQQRLLELVRQGTYQTQKALQAELERQGFAVTQSSLSRDLEELNLVKLGGRYVLPRAPVVGAARGLLSLEPAGDALVVAKCLPGHASAVALAIDTAALADVVGTIAGDDTVFVAVLDRHGQRAAIKAIWEHFAAPGWG